MGMAPRPAQPGVWGGGISCDGTFVVPNEPRIGVFVYSSPPPSLADHDFQHFRSCPQRESGGLQVPQPEPP